MVCDPLSSLIDRAYINESETVSEGLEAFIVPNIVHGCDLLWSGFSYVPYIGIVTILMNDYPKFKVGFFSALFVVNFKAFIKHLYYSCYY